MPTISVNSGFYMRPENCTRGWSKWICATKISSRMQTTWPLVKLSGFRKHRGMRGFYTAKRDDLQDINMYTHKHTQRWSSFVHICSLIVSIIYIYIYLQIYIIYINIHSPRPLRKHIDSTRCAINWNVTQLLGEGWQCCDRQDMVQVRALRVARAKGILYIYIYLYTGKTLRSLTSTIGFLYTYLTLAWQTKKLVKLWPKHDVTLCECPVKR